MAKSFLIDTTLCTGCRGCQVACKQWHDLPAEPTVNMGSFQNPQDLSFTTYKLVRMQEHVIDGGLKWLFFPEQCRHCIDAPCEATAGEPTAIFTDPMTGAVLYTAITKDLPAEEIIESCPYDIPRMASDGTLAKCDMCQDRVENGLLPACVKTCPTGAMSFGERDEIVEQANSHLMVARKKFKNANLIDVDTIRVIYLVAFKPELYHDFAVASNGQIGITRQIALQRMFRPFKRAGAQLMRG